MNRLDAQIRAFILHCLCEGLSQRGCERVFKVSNKTVAKLFEEAGDMAIAYVDSLKDLTPKRIQADELHAFVAAKQKNVADMMVPDKDAGTVWTYLAMCADTKLIFSYHLGDRGVEDATIFARDVASKLKRTDRGDLALRPSIVTDGLKAYDEAFDLALGSDADRAVIVKRYEHVESGGKRGAKRYVGADRENRTGEVDPADIHTNYIERQNGNLRMGNRRFGRRVNAFSKTLLNHKRHLALWIMYHNLCWIPRPSRPQPDENGEISGGWIKRLPAALEAGLTDHVWEIEDLLALTDEFVRQRKQAQGTAEAETIEQPDPADIGDSKPTYWVFHHLTRHATKVHHSNCCNCRDGRGKKDGASKAGEWLPFHSEEEAIEAAKQLQPDRHSVCNMCLGEVRSLGYRHKGSSRQTPAPS